MTTPQKTGQTVHVEPERDSRLEQLLAQYDAVKSAAEEAKKRFEDLKAEIKNELSFAAPGQQKVRVESTYLNQSLQMICRGAWKLDSRSLKAEEPDVWVRYAERKFTWYLEAAR